MLSLYFLFDLHKENTTTKLLTLQRERVSGVFLHIHEHTAGYECWRMETSLSNQLQIKKVKRRQSVAKWSVGGLIISLPKAMSP